MSVWGWIAIGLMTVIGIIDWIIVMGTNPRKWKGGDCNDGDMEAYRRDKR